MGKKYKKKVQWRQLSLNEVQAKTGDQNGEECEEEEEGEGGGDGEGVGGGTGTHSPTRQPYHHNNYHNNYPHHHNNYHHHNPYHNINNNNNNFPRRGGPHHNNFFRRFDRRGGGNGGGFDRYNENLRNLENHGPPYGKPPFYDRNFYFDKQFHNRPPYCDARAFKFGYPERGRRPFRPYGHPGFIPRGFPGHYLPDGSPHKGGFEGYMGQEEEGGEEEEWEECGVENGGGGVEEQQQQLLLQQQQQQQQQEQQGSEGGGKPSQPVHTVMINNEEYTKIQTPRQEVIFKKSSLDRRQDSLDQASLAGSLTSSTSSTASSSSPSASSSSTPTSTPGDTTPPTPGPTQDQVSGEDGSVSGSMEETCSLSVTGDDPGEPPHHHDHVFDDPSEMFVSEGGGPPLAGVVMQQAYPGGPMYTIPVHWTPFLDPGLIPGETALTPLDPAFTHVIDPKSLPTLIDPVHILPVQHDATGCPVQVQVKVDSNGVPIQIEPSAFTVSLNSLQHPHHHHHHEREEEGAGEKVEREGEEEEEGRNDEDSGDGGSTKDTEGEENGQMEVDIKDDTGNIEATKDTKENGNAEMEDEDKEGGEKEENEEHEEEEDSGCVEESTDDAQTADQPKSTSTNTRVSSTSSPSRNKDIPETKQEDETNQDDESKEANTRLETEEKEEEESVLKITFEEVKMQEQGTRNDTEKGNKYRSKRKGNENTAGRKTRNGRKERNGQKRQKEKESKQQQKECKNPKEVKEECKENKCNQSEASQTNGISEPMIECTEQTLTNPKQTEEPDASKESEQQQQQQCDTVPSISIKPREAAPEPPTTTPVKEEEEEEEDEEEEDMITKESEDASDSNDSQYATMSEASTAPTTPSAEPAEDPHHPHHQEQQPSDLHHLHHTTTTTTVVNKMDSTNSNNQQPDSSTVPNNPGEEESQTDSQATVDSSNDPNPPLQQQQQEQQQPESPQVLQGYVMVPILTPYYDPSVLYGYPVVVAGQQQQQQQQHQQSPPPPHHHHGYSKRKKKKYQRRRQTDAQASGTYLDPQLYTGEPFVATPGGYVVPLDPSGSVCQVHGIQYVTSAYPQHQLDEGFVSVQHSPYLPNSAPEPTSTVPSQPSEAGSQDDPNRTVFSDLQDTERQQIQEILLQERSKAGKSDSTESSDSGVSESEETPAPDSSPSPQPCEKEESSLIASETEQTTAQGCTNEITGTQSTTTGDYIGVHNESINDKPPSVLEVSDKQEEKELKNQTSSCNAVDSEHVNQSSVDETSEITVTSQEVVVSVAASDTNTSDCDLDLSENIAESNTVKENHVTVEEKKDEYNSHDIITESHSHVTSCVPSESENLAQPCTDILPSAVSEVEVAQVSENNVKYLHDLHQEVESCVAENTSVNGLISLNANCKDELLEPLQTECASSQQPCEEQVQAISEGCLHKDSCEASIQVEKCEASVRECRENSNDVNDGGTQNERTDPGGTIDSEVEQDTLKDLKVTEAVKRWIRDVTPEKAFNLSEEVQTFLLAERDSIKEMDTEDEYIEDEISENTKPTTIQESKNVKRNPFVAASSNAPTLGMEGCSKRVALMNKFRGTTPDVLDEYDGASTISNLSHDRLYSEASSSHTVSRNHSFDDEEGDKYSENPEIYNPSAYTKYYQLGVEMDETTPTASPPPKSGSRSRDCTPSAISGSETVSECGSEDVETIPHKYDVAEQYSETAPMSLATEILKAEKVLSNMTHIVGSQETTVAHQSLEYPDKYLRDYKTIPSVEIGDSGVQSEESSDETETQSNIGSSGVGSSLASTPAVSPAHIKGRPALQSHPLRHIATGDGPVPCRTVCCAVM